MSLDTFFCHCHYHCIFHDTYSSHWVEYVWIHWVARCWRRCIGRRPFGVFVPSLIWVFHLGMNSLEETKKSLVVVKMHCWYDIQRDIQDCIVANGVPYFGLYYPSSCLLGVLNSYEGSLWRNTLAHPHFYKTTAKSLSPRAFYWGSKIPRRSSVDRWILKSLAQSTMLHFPKRSLVRVERVCFVFTYHSLVISVVNRKVGLVFS